MSKDISKKEIREFYKNKAGISEAEDVRKTCAKCCFFNNISKYCGEHKIKTTINESCSKFKRQRPYKVYSSGAISPR